MTKPYDPTPILSKIQQYEDDYNQNNPHGNVLDLQGLKICCPEVAIITDAKDFKPYIMAALDQFADVMGLEVTRQNRRNDRY